MNNRRKKYISVLLVGLLGVFIAPSVSGMGTITRACADSVYTGVSPRTTALVSLGIGAVSAVAAGKLLYDKHQQIVKTVKTQETRRTDIVGVNLKAMQENYAALSRDVTSVAQEIEGHSKARGEVLEAANRLLRRHEQLEDEHEAAQDDNRLLREAAQTRSEENGKLLMTCMYLYKRMGVLRQAYIDSTAQSSENAQMFAADMERNHELELNRLNKEAALQRESIERLEKDSADIRINFEQQSKENAMLRTDNETVRKQLHDERAEHNRLADEMRKRLAVLGIAEERLKKDLADERVTNVLARERNQALLAQVQTWKRGTMLFGVLTSSLGAAFMGASDCSSSSSRYS